MSRMADMALEIEERLIAGDSMDVIVASLKVPEEWVQSVAEMIEADNDYQPDEAQEWHDFDPDC